MFVVQFLEILVLQQYDVASFAGIFDIFFEQNAVGGSLGNSYSI